MQMTKRLLWLALLTLTATSLAACTKSINYVDPAGPRYAGCPADTIAPPVVEISEGLRVATFNIKHAREIDQAIELLLTDPDLSTVDLLFLQEMDAPGCERIAGALCMHYVYYPASVHPQSGHDFGNAILARWPIEDDRKIILPHLANYTNSQRIAVTGTITPDGPPVRLYSVHFATPFGVGPQGRRDQVEAVLADALAFPGPSIIAGDFNKHSMGEPFEEAGFEWPTKHLGRTVLFWDVDHIVTRGLEMKDSGTAGIVKDNHDASDHKPVWAVVQLEGWQTFSATSIPCTVVRTSAGVMSKMSSSLPDTTTPPFCP
jgi:endonuclease/exonuclease/phosphatase family metal-dependent hydrolase